MALSPTLERERLQELDPLGRQAVALADIKVRRLLDIREQIMAEIQRRQYSPDVSCEQIIEYANCTNDPLAPDRTKIKVFEKF